MDTKILNWHKSSYSGQANTCVEVAEMADGSRLVRDTNDRDGAMLSFPASSWRSLTDDLRQH